LLSIYIVRNAGTGPTGTNHDHPVTPEFIFDEGYCTWYGMSPNDLEENARVHQELMPLQKEDKLLYFNELKRIRLAQFAELKKAGWRKAQNI